MKYLKLLLNFIFKSSADPKKVSASVRYFLVGLIPFTLQAVGLACGLTEYCWDVDASTLEALIEDIAQGVYYITLAVASIGTAYGIGRKVIRTITGQNLAIRDTM